jgi:hypothetical protein
VSIWTMVGFAFTLAAYPLTHVFTLYNWLISFLLVLRVAHYWTVGYHMFLTDFCYVCNVAILWFINFAPQSEELFRVCFICAVGPLTFSLIAF